MFDGDVDQLLLLLDRYLFLRGETITSYLHDVSSSHPAIKSEPGSTISALDNMPVALQYFAPIDLDRHLEEIALEQEELHALTVRISATCLDRDLVARARDRLVAEFAIIRPDDVQWFSEKGVPEMLATLRAMQQRATAQAAVQTFKLTAVASILYDGSPENLVTYVLRVRILLERSLTSISRYHLSSAASWYEVQEALTAMTYNWQTRESGCLDGYSLRDGKWKYQIVQNGIPSKVVYDLAICQQYHHLRRTMDAENANVLIWHVSMRGERESRTH